MSVSTTRGKPRYLYSTKDILTIAAIAVVGGVTAAFAVGPWAKFIEGILGPFGMALDFPFFAFWATLAALLIRKPGVALVTSVLFGLCEMLFGGVDGAITIVFCIMQGIGAELGLLAFRYRSTLIASMFSNALSAVLCTITTLYVYSFVVFDFVLQVGLFAWMFVVGGAAGGLLSWLIARGVRKTGVYSA